MAENTPPIRLVNFVSQDELDEAKRTRGERAEDGTAQRDRPLFEILKENKDKSDAEFNERFKHRPPKALDEDETEFLDNLEMTQKEYERQLADEEASELQKFQAAVAAQSVIVQEIKETTPALNIEEPRLTGKKAANRLLGVVIKVKPQAKRAKLDQSGSAKPDVDSEGMHTSNMAKTSSVVDNDTAKSAEPIGSTDKSHSTVKTCLVSYSDESDED